jgi:hypothetical protein
MNQGIMSTVSRSACLLAVVGSACSAGSPDDVEPEPLTTQEQPLALECADEAALLELSTEANPCRRPFLWTSPIHYEPLDDWESSEKNALTNAMRDWEAQTGNLVTFEELLPENSTVTPRVKFADEQGQCRSVFGMEQPNGVMVVKLRGCGSWSTRHELGHLLGLYHGQQRSDRDRYVLVRQEKFCAPPGCAGAPISNVCGAGGSPNCDSVGLFIDSVKRCVDGDSADGFRYGPFDFNSVMLYSSAFPAEECCTGHESGCGMVKRNGTLIPPGAAAVSPGDGSAVIEMYRELDGWTRFRPIVRTDPGSTSPLDTRPTSTATMTGSPALARWDSTTIVALARGGDSHIYFKLNPDSDISWPTGFWTDIGGNFGSDPAAVSWAPGRLDVVGLGADGNIWHKWHLNGTWGSSWGNLGKPGTSAVSAPAIASWGPDRLDVFVRSGSTLFQKTWDGSAWSSWVNRGGAIKGKPAAVSWGANRIDVVATGTDNAVWTQPFENGTWFGWGSIGGSVMAGTSPAIASGGPNRLNIYVTGSNGGLWHKSWSGAWSAFVEIGGRPASSPGAFTQSSGRAHVAVRMNNGSFEGVWHRFWD